MDACNSLLLTDLHQLTMQRDFVDRLAGPGALLVDFGLRRAHGAKADAAAPARR